jgi:hypothetical protein
MDDACNNTTPTTTPTPPTTVQVEINNLPSPSERKTKARGNCSNIKPKQVGREDLELASREWKERIVDNL